MRRNDENAVILALKKNSDHSDIKYRKYWWIIDSGSTSHMTNSLEGLYDIKEEHSTVLFGNENSDENVSIIGKKT